MGERKHCIAMFERVWSSTAELCSDLDEERWASPTDLPGWSVKDVLAHLSGTEGLLLGRSPAGHDIEIPPHVRNPLGERNEIEVDFRRPWSGDKVLQEFEEVTEARLGILRKMTDDDFAADSWTPMGPGTYGQFMAARILDCWVHEQDIRRALNRPGHLEGAAPQHCFERLLSGMPKVVGKNAGAPEGSLVMLDVEGAERREVVIGVEGGRASILGASPREVDVRLVMDLQTFVCLACGRWDPARAVRSGMATVQGDVDLGTRIVSAMNVMV